MEPHTPAPAAPSRRQFVVAAALLAAGSALTVPATAREDDAPPPAVAARYDSGPLGRFALGRWQRVRVTTFKTGDAALLTLDPNRIAWDGYSPTWASTRMAELPLRVRLREVKGYKTPAGKPKPAYPVRLYDLAPTDLPAGRRFADLGLGARVRLTVSDAPGVLPRLLLLDDRDRITRVLLLEKDGAPAAPTGGDLISLTTGFLGGETPARTSYIRLSGSLSSGTVQVTVDGNAVGLDPVGDPAFSTMMAPLPREAKLTEKSDLSPEAAAAARVFTLDGADRPLLLLLPRKPGGDAPRLVLSDESGKPVGYLPLEGDYTAARPLTSAASWRLVKITYSDGKTVTPEQGGTYSLQFTPDGRVAGRAGVNRLTAGYTVAGNRIEIGPTASTRAAALNPGVESDFLKALGQVGSFKVEGDELWLMLRTDSGTMVLRRDK
jgi:heat shock protein HslJ